ncbi:unnamed protein product [Prunus brigantina]
MGIDRNDPRARQLLEKLLKKGPGPSGSVRTGPPPVHPVREVVVPTPTVEARSLGMGRGQDRGKRPVGEERDAPGAKRPRVEEMDMGGAVAGGLRGYNEDGALGQDVLGGADFGREYLRLVDRHGALFSHYGAVRRVMIHREKDVARVAELRRNREEAGKRDAEVKAVVDRANRTVEESKKKEVEAVRALGAAQVEKADLAKERDRLREKTAQLKEENIRLQKALENACQPQAEDVKSFLESEGGAELAGEIRLSGGMDLLEKIQKRYPDFVFSLEYLLGEDEDEGPGGQMPPPSAGGQETEDTGVPDAAVVQFREPAGEAEAGNV